MKTIAHEISNLVSAIHNCEKNGNSVWAGTHRARLDSIVSEFLPSGSGFDNGTKIRLEDSTGEKLVFDIGYHHMNEHGGYDGWTEHEITVTASLMFGINIKISGRNRNDIKDYISEYFSAALNQEFSPSFYKQAA